MDRLTQLQTGRADAPEVDPPATWFFLVAGLAVAYSLAVVARICWPLLFL